MSSLAFIARLIVKSNGKQTDAQLKDLSAAERAELARLLEGMNHPELVTWTVEAVVDDGSIGALSERDARAVAVDIGVKSSRFAAAAALGEIPGMALDTRGRRWFEHEALVEWAEVQVAGTDEDDAEQQDDDGDPGCAQSYRTPWGPMIFWLLVLVLAFWWAVRFIWFAIAV